MVGSYKVAFVKDNFSKAILNWKILDRGNSMSIKGLVEEAFHKNGLDELPESETVTIVTDDGSENKGELIRWIDGLTSPRTIKVCTKQKSFQTQTA